MLKNYFKVAIKNLIRWKVHSVITVVGLTIGIAASVVILLSVQYQFSYDKFNKDYSHIYRVATYSGDKGSAITPARLGPLLKENLPGIENFTRVFNLNIGGESIVRYGQNTYYEKGIIFADSSFFSVFSYDVLEGNRSSLLRRPFSIVLTKLAAHKYFGESDPIGKIVQVSCPVGTYNFTVTGVVNSPPQNSSLQFDFVASFSTLYESGWRDFFSVDSWGGRNFYTYIVLCNSCSAKSIDSKLDVLTQHLAGLGEDNSGAETRFFLQPLKDIHLFSDLSSDFQSNGNVNTLYIFLAIAFLLLFIASVNSVILTTAKHLTRAKEIAVRKIMGASRLQIVLQYLGESLLINLIAMIGAALLVELLIPFIKNYLSYSVGLDLLGTKTSVLTLAGVAFVTGIVSGIFPAFYLASFQPTEVLRRKDMGSGQARHSRNGLVFLQFVISIALIIIGVTSYRQLHYIQNFNLGFNKTNLLIISLPRQLPLEKSVRRLRVYQREIEMNPDVKMTSGASGYPGMMRMRTTIHEEGKTSHDKIMSIASVDDNFLNTIGATIEGGQSFSHATHDTELIVNETAQKELGSRSLIGTELTTGWGGTEGRVIGVVRDFSFESLRERIGPLVLTVAPRRFRYLICRISSKGHVALLHFLRERWEEVYPGIPFEYSFLDDDLDGLYVAQQKFGQMVALFAGLAVLIACMGLYGLSSFNAEQRTKEVGIRKVLGGSAPQIVGSISGKSVAIVLWANIIAWPAAYYFLDRWLQGFAYHVTIGIGVFISGALLSALLAFISACFPAIRAATANPATTLRYE